MHLDLSTSKERSETRLPCNNRYQSRAEVNLLCLCSGCCGNARLQPLRTWMYSDLCTPPEPFITARMITMAHNGNSDGWLNDILWHSFQSWRSSICFVVLLIWLVAGVTILGYHYAEIFGLIDVRKSCQRCRANSTRKHLDASSTPTSAQRHVAGPVNNQIHTNYVDDPAELNIPLSYPPQVLIGSVEDSPLARRRQSLSQKKQKDL